MKVINRIFLLTAAAIVPLVAACTENDNSVFRSQELVRDKGPSLIMDAKQRVVTNIDIVNKSVAGQVLPKRIVCAEPSPDVAQGVSEAIKVGLEASIKDKKAGSFNFDSSSAASIAQLGERLAAIQLLRDISYRNCEAYANGAISATSYTVFNSRLHKTIVTLLSSEMTAGAFGRALAQIGGSANTAGGESVATAQARQEFEDAVKAYEAAKGSTKEDEAKTALADKAVKLAATQAGASSTAATASASNGGALGQISGGGATNVSADLRKIHQQFMDDNSFVTLTDACVTELNRLNITVKTENGEDVLAEADFSQPLFRDFCVDQILPRAVNIANQESIGKILVQGMRAHSAETATLINAEASRLEQVNALIDKCKSSDGSVKKLCDEAAVSMPKAPQTLGTLIGGNDAFYKKMLDHLATANSDRAGIENTLAVMRKGREILKAEQKNIELYKLSSERALEGFLLRLENCSSKNGAERKRCDSELTNRIKNFKEGIFK